MKIGILSDNHSYWPEQVYTHFKNVDEIWHAGDIGSIDTLKKLQEFKPTKAVWGNIDDMTIRQQTQEHLIFNIDNVKVYMTHIGGYPPKYNKASLPYLNNAKPNLFISGHRHILKVMYDDARNCLHINPGACGQQGWHKVKTLITIDIFENNISNLKIIEL
jgi:uncharacterized protein